jgi:hypothetical protein
MNNHLTAFQLDVLARMRRAKLDWVATATEDHWKRKCADPAALGFDHSVWPKDGELYKTLSDLIGFANAAGG